MMKLFSGVLDDPRPPEEKQKDYRSEEVVTTCPIWSVKDKLREYPIYHQDGSGACVAFTFAKLIATEVKKLTQEWIDFSPSFIYKRRSNQTTAGMNIANAADIVRREGSTLEALMKSQNLTEVQINSVHETYVATEIAKGVSKAVNSYLYVVPNIERIATIIDQGHSVGLVIFADWEEYSDTPQVLKNLTYAEAQIRHMVTAVDYFLHPDLGKCLWIEDSWGVGHGQGGRRVFTKNFVNTRTQLAIYLDGFEFDTKEIEKITFTTPVQFAERNDEVRKVQDFLKSQGTFPSNQESTGYYGNITARAVIDWQLKELEVPEAQLKEWGGRFWGPASIKRANEIQ